MSDFLKGVAIKVRAARDEKGLSVRELALLCNMDYSNISRMEQGKRDIRLSTLKTIADVLNKEVKDFL